MSIHPTALVAATALVPRSCSIGPFCTVGPEVELGESCELVSHVVLEGRTRLGAGNRVYPFACLGVAPQDLKYKGEPSGLHVGDGNTFRECVTVSRGTAGGGGVTRIGSHCLIMAYTHIGHDSFIGNHCILANGATLAGHVTVEDHASVGALCPIHQYCRIGTYAYIGGGTTITQDVLPYSLTSARRDTHAYGLNKVGLTRARFSPAQMTALRRAYRTLLASRLNTAQALERLRSEDDPEPCVRYLLEFIETSQRGVLK